MNIFNNNAKFKGVLGIILILVTITSIYFWENYGRQEFTYTDVIVFKEDVPENKIVKEKMLGVMKLESSTLIDDVITDPNEIIGK
ncbi:MAG: SAF domain-containing protein, partial [Clostridia bacterium]|nr:SAF domain-containing protein [Clostridia bacterium]